MDTNKDSTAPQHPATTAGSSNNTATGPSTDSATRAAAVALSALAQVAPTTYRQGTAGQSSSSSAPLVPTSAGPIVPALVGDSRLTGSALPSPETSVLIATGSPSVSTSGSVVSATTHSITTVSSSATPSNTKSRSKSSSKSAAPSNKRVHTKTKGPVAAAKKVYSQQVVSKNDKGKRATISPAGTIILSKGNNIDTSTLKKGIPRPDMLNLDLIDTQGNLHKRFFPEKDEMNWDDDKCIGKANRWRRQTLKRLMKRDSDYLAQGVRSRWSAAETEGLKASVNAEVKAVGDRGLTTMEWEQVTKEHNKKFAGATISVGDKLVGGQSAKTPQDTTDRTAKVIQVMFNRKKDLKEFYSELTGEMDRSDDDASQDDNESSSEESDKERSAKRPRHGGDFDPRLEDPSDDEKDGQRQASTHTGARLVAC